MWTLPELVAEVSQQIAALPAPKNGQVRAVPDERTIRYYQTIGLLDRPAAMRGRTALYNLRHVAQVVAIKRLQAGGRSLAEIQALWPTLDDQTLTRMSGLVVDAHPAPKPTRSDFWKRAPAPASSSLAASASPGASSMSSRAAGAAPRTSAALEVRVELAPHIVLLLTPPDDGVAVSSADVRAIRAAAASLVAELASRRLVPNSGGEEP
jgi:DNA-binding transcriptional MerR regulator